MNCIFQLQIFNLTTTTTTTTTITTKTKQDKQKKKNNNQKKTTTSVVTFPISTSLQLLTGFNNKESVYSTNAWTCSVTNANASVWMDMQCDKTTGWCSKVR